MKKSNAPTGATSSAQGAIVVPPAPPEPPVHAAAAKAVTPAPEEKTDPAVQVSRPLGDAVRELLSTVPTSLAGHPDMTPAKMEAYQKARQAVEAALAE